MSATATPARKAFLGFTTRSLLICVVLGAATIALIHLARFMGVLLFGVAPWLGRPSALIPYFVLLIVAMVGCRGGIAGVGCDGRGCSGVGLGSRSGVGYVELVP